MTQIVAVTTGKQIEKVADLAREIWTQHYTPIIGKEQVNYMLDKFQSQSAIREQLDQGVKYYLIKHLEKWVGYLSFKTDDDLLFLSKIYLLRSERGRGLGKTAVKFLEDHAREQGLRKIKLTVNKYNSNSIRAYERMGFTNEGDIVQDIGNGFVMDDYVYEKIVD